ncbi:MAG: hypothetical protein OXJ52_09630 [Oligoflexia bacterium]|nr:hypothetical protein [Oligoflexia bacterium]
MFFLTYSESNREKNWLRLKSLFPKARRVHGIKGLALAHQICAKLSNSSFFFVVNGDNEVCPSFNFSTPEKILKPAVYCWRSLNPVNGLIYGFGGIKLFPKKAFSANSSFVDISTSLKLNYKVVPEVASITRFNGSALSAWRGAFRECVKLSSECINNQKTGETRERLSIWCEKGAERMFGEYVLLGAKQGKEYGQTNKENPKALSKINDFNWLKQFFKTKAQNKIQTGSV